MNAIGGPQFPELLLKLIGIKAAVTWLIAGDPVSCEVGPPAEGADIFLFFIHNNSLYLKGLYSAKFVNPNH
jgi:hypothetical protein